MNTKSYLPEGKCCPLDYMTKAEIVESSFSIARVKGFSQKNWKGPVGGACSFGIVVAALSLPSKLFATASLGLCIFELKHLPRNPLLGTGCNPNSKPN